MDGESWQATVHGVTKSWTRLSDFTHSLILKYVMCSVVHAQQLSRVRHFATPWTVAHKVPLSIGFPSKNTGVGCHFFPRGSSQPRDRTCVSCIPCIGRQIVNHCATWETPVCEALSVNVTPSNHNSPKKASEQVSPCRCTEYKRRSSVVWFLT